MHEKKNPTYQVNILKMCLKLYILNLSLYGALKDKLYSLKMLNEKKKLTYQVNNLKNTYIWQILMQVL